MANLVSHSLPTLEYASPRRSNEKLRTLAMHGVRTFLRFTVIYCVATILLVPSLDSADDTTPVIIAAGAGIVLALVGLVAASAGAQDK